LAQNEEALKKCAQDYLARVKQEEQRYQALKVHAEEKLDRSVRSACSLLRVWADTWIYKVAYLVLLPSVSLVYNLEGFVDV
jgi:hypothetical protein